MKNDHGTGGRVARTADLLNDIGPSHQAIAARAVRLRLGMRARRLAARPNVVQNWVLPGTAQTVNAALAERRAAMKRQIAGLFA